MNCIESSPWFLGSIGIICIGCSINLVTAPSLSSKLAESSAGYTASAIICASHHSTSGTRPFSASLGTSFANWVADVMPVFLAMVEMSACKKEHGNSEYVMLERFNYTMRSKFWLHEFCDLTWSCSSFDFIRSRFPSASNLPGSLNLNAIRLGRAAALPKTRVSKN